jgi:tripartite-type tricarboxylate transporter receptor subunit TctC
MSLLKVCAQICVLASIWAGVALPAQAQDYPARTITIVVPLAPGSGMDAVARIYADRLSQAFGKPVLYKQVNYDAVKDFTPVSFYLKSPFILVVNTDLPVKTVPDLIKLAKESKTPLNFSSLGAGSPQHLSIEYMKQRFGFDMTHVPYRNTPQSITDIVANRV